MLKLINLKNLFVKNKENEFVDLEGINWIYLSISATLKEKRRDYKRYLKKFVKRAVFRRKEEENGLKKIDIIETEEIAKFFVDVVNGVFFLHYMSLGFDERVFIADDISNFIDGLAKNISKFEEQEIATLVNCCNEFEKYDNKEKKSISSLLTVPFDLINEALDEEVEYLRY